MKRKLVNIGDGRIIEMAEEGVTTPPPRQKEDRSHYKPHKQRPKKPKKGECPANTAREEVPGMAEWFHRRLLETTTFRNNPLAGFKKRGRFGVPSGMGKKTAAKHWAAARKQAREDMANLKKTGAVDIKDERAEMAMVATLEIMRSPMNQDMRLKAARQILEWTAAKPASNQNVTVNAAEAWLASIAEEADGKGDS